MTSPPTARDAAAVQRPWNARVLSDADVDRALAELGVLVGQRDKAAGIVERLRQVWPREALREAEAWLEATAPKRRWSGNQPSAPSGAISSARS